MLRIQFGLPALLLCICTHATESQQLETKRDVNLRKGPASSSAVITTLDSGSTVDQLSRRGGYDRVQTSDGTKGWIYARFLRPASRTSAADSSAASTSAGDSSATGKPAPSGVTSRPANPARPPAAITGIASSPADIESLGKIAPREAGNPQCADPGTPSRPGTPYDTATNLLKNRIDQGEYHDVTIGAVLALPWKNLPRRRYQFSAAQLAQTARYEGAAIALTGYIVTAKLEGPETTNCELTDPTWHDWHVWLVETPAEAANKDRTNAVVFEVTPRVRSLGTAAWDIHQLMQWASSSQKVRVSGWLMLDPEHPDQGGKTRGTTWEIHPVMEVTPVP